MRGQRSAIRIDAATQALRPHGDDRAGDRQSKERKLLFQQPRKTFCGEDRRLTHVSGLAPGIAIRRSGQ